MEDNQFTIDVLTYKGRDYADILGLLEFLEIGKTRVGSHAVVIDELIRIIKNRKKKK